MMSDGTKWASGLPQTLRAAPPRPAELSCLFQLGQEDPYFQLVVRLSGLNVSVLEAKWWRAAIEGRASYIWRRHEGTKTTNSFAR